MIKFLFKKSATIALVLLTLSLAGLNVHQYLNPIVKTIEEKVIVEKPVYIDKEVIVEKVKEVLVEVAPEPSYNISSTDRELIARCVYREAGGASVECQQHVASVIINRWKNGYWGDTFSEVIYAPGQFTVASSLSYTTPPELSYEAVDHVIWNGPTLPEYVMYFKAYSHFIGSGYVPYLELDNTYFGYYEKDLEG